jgi:hypothetical protein
MSYYYELWAHEVMRVFGDRLTAPCHKADFTKEMRKEALVKFKENFNISE